VFCGIVTAPRTGRTGRLTISELAKLAGVTTRAVRHYHGIGLMPEPERDSSGYRRYDGRDVVALVRIVRLRAVGMPIPQIAERLAAEPETEGSLADALQALATELDGEIAQLTATRDQLRALASDESFDQPGKALATALQQHGALGPSDQLVAGEEWAAALLDALHPQGISGVLDDASNLLSDPAAMARLGALRERFRRLGDRPDNTEIDSLADEVAAVLVRPGQETPLLDIDLLESLLTDRMNRSRRRFIDRLRAKAATAATGEDGR
jgi:DNA-binding transcriptional MerR regulator